MEKKIGENVSSGAEKVERIERERTRPQTDAPEKAQHERQPDGAGAKGAPSKKKETETAAERERRAAQTRFEAAKTRAARKEARQTERAKSRQKQLSCRLEARQKRAEVRAAKRGARTEQSAKRAARREMLANESRAEREKRLLREKREKLALRHQRAQARTRAAEQRRAAREAAQDRRAQARKERRDRRKSGGLGGWIAAVSALGAACLALAVVVAADSYRMNELRLRTENACRATLYELVSVSEELDDRFAKLRVSSGANEQRMLLTDILVETAVLEAALEKIPVDAATSTDISLFVNRTGAYADRLLAKLAAGEGLSARDKEVVARLGAIGAGLSRELNELALHLPADQLRTLLEGGGDLRTAHSDGYGRGMRERGEISEAPFSGTGNVGKNALIGAAEISQAQAETCVKTYFKAYHIAAVRCTGETAARGMHCYNFVLTDEDGAEIFAQITKSGGKLAFFDTYEACTQKNFDFAGCSAAAERFLREAGYDGLTAVWFSDAGSVADITYVAEQAGVRLYPDMVRVRVCEQRGRVVGMDARGYLFNHHGLRETQATLSQAAARERLNASLTVRAEHLALIPLHGREVLAYEFYCTSGDEAFFVYLDAHSGEEVQIFRVHSGAQGRYLK